MASMSVIGIDFGNESCYVAVARAGGIETIANDYSLRATPSCVAFSGKNRLLGVAAHNQMVTNMKNTIHGFKRLLGRMHSDPHVVSEIKSLPFNVQPQNHGQIGIKVNYMNEDHVFSPEQISAMLFTKLKDTAEQGLKTMVNDCVISVPSYFTNAERKALLDSAQIAGLNVLRLMNETTATALTYGIYKQDLPEPDDKPRNVFFVDCGHSSLQVSAVAFNKGKLKMLATAADSNLGGRDIDRILAEYFCKDFETRYKINPRTNPKAYLRLSTEVEKLKKQMSANSTKLPLNIECFMDDKDVHGEIKRDIMEELCAHLFRRVEQTMKRCLEDSKLRPEEIHSVEIVGGTSRIPAIKQLIEQVFGKTASTTLNQDEAVARGCALQCAILSPAVRVRDFSVTDLQNYPIKLVWDSSLKEDGELEVFPANHQVPYSKMLTFYRKENFNIKAFYNCDIPYPDREIGQFIIKEVKPTPEGESSKIKVKARINIHGIFSITSASLVEKKESTEEETPMEVASPENGAAPAGQPGPGEAMDQTAPPQENGEPTDDKDKKDSKKKKHVTKTVDLPIETYTHGFTQTMLNDYQEQECKMIASDKQEKERADARNALEEYVYDARGRITNDDDLGTFILDGDKERFVRELDNMENWLYEEGEDCSRHIYVEKLQGLRIVGEPIKVRKAEFENRNAALEELAQRIMVAQKVTSQYRSGDEKYNHIPAADVAKVEETVSAAAKWLEENRTLLSSCPRTQDPPVTVSIIKEQCKSLEQAVMATMNKPKPKVEPPPTEPSGDKAPAEPKQGETPAEQQNMDVE
uniref:Heat shock 70 kDa protein 4L n=1 Tax=Lygus hesperus TaxID=30085 RepID=A0A0A9XY29_LYGHE